MAEGEPCVVDASVLVDLGTRRRGWRSVAAALAGRPLHAPAHVDAEVLSALGRLERAGALDEPAADQALERFRSAPLERHLLDPLVSGAWRRRRGVRVSDAFYLELAEQLGTTVLTSDARLARASALATLAE